MGSVKRPLEAQGRRHRGGEFPSLGPHLLAHLGRMLWVPPTAVDLHAPMFPPLHPRRCLLSAERWHDERRAGAPEEEGQTGGEKGLLLGHAGNCTRSPVPLEQQSRRTRVRAAALCRVTAGEPASVVEAAGIEPTEFGAKQRVLHVSGDLRGRGGRLDIACSPWLVARCAALVTQ